MNDQADVATESRWAVADDLYSSGKTHGSYHPFHFVVRLDSDLHDILKSRPSGLFSSGECDQSHLSAFATYVHETIHWWQHIGSTTGLMLSLAYPAAAHVNHDRLVAILSDIGGKKSLKTFSEVNGSRLSEASQRQLNIVLNNWHDTEFNRRIISNPRCLEELVNNPFFDSVGHSLAIGLTHALWLLIATVDSDARYLPDIRQWESQFEGLRANRVEGFYPGSQIKRFPLGALHIFEGQARYCQLQYLYLATGGSDSWSEFKKRGMLSERYVAAFKWFLKWAELDWPSSPIDSTVQLFLLVCDLAINPSDGYPFDLRHFESFIESVDPGFRFAFFSHEIAKRREIRSAVAKCTRSGYIEVTSLLARSLVCKQPVEIAERIVHWANSEDALKQLLKEEETFIFHESNLPVRLYFAKHIRFAEDRVKRPEFFCWPAMHFVGNSLAEPDLSESMRLWDRHQPLFFADLEGEIRPMLREGQSEDSVHRTFNSFYSWNVLYDVVRQWIMSDGPFNFDYGWLTPNYSVDELKQWASRSFGEVFGASLDDFELVKDAK